MLRQVSRFVGLLVVALLIVAVGPLGGGAGRVGAWAAAAPAGPGGLEAAADPSDHTVFLPMAVSGYSSLGNVQLLGPANGSTLNTLAPLFEWALDRTVVGGELWVVVASAPGFADDDIVLLDFVDAEAGAWEGRFFGNLDPATTYYWRVELWKGDEMLVVSPVWSFKTGSAGTLPAAPTLVSPANGATGVSTDVLLTWTAVSGAVEYVYIYTPMSQWQIVIDWVDNTQGAPNLAPGTAYQWSACARNAYGYGAVPDPWSFTTAGAATTATGAGDVAELGAGRLIAVKR